MGYLLYACYKQQRQQLAGIDYVFSGLEFVPFSKRADSRYDGQAWAYYGCLNLFANTRRRRKEKKTAGRRERGARSSDMYITVLFLSLALYSVK